MSNVKVDKPMKYDESKFTDKSLAVFAFDVLMCFKEIKTLDSKFVDTLVSNSVPTLRQLFTKYINNGFFDTEFKFRMSSEKNKSDPKYWGPYIPADEIVTSLYCIGSIIKSVRLMGPNCNCVYTCRDTTDIEFCIFDKFGKFIVSWSF